MTTFDPGSPGIGPSILNARCLCCGGTNVGTGGCNVCTSRTWYDGKLIKCACGFKAALPPHAHEDEVLFDFDVLGDTMVRVIG